MYYSEEEARLLVVEAGLRLIEEGLIARTWGNISARISKDEFIITPSGRAYETLKPEDLVKVKADDLSYDGDIKPSSELGIHAIAYILRPEIKFIIHTHQFYASIIGMDGENQSFAANVAYGLPGTKALRDNCMQSISRHPGINAFFLRNHGALCLGQDMDDAFDVATKLELVCKTMFNSVIDMSMGLGVETEEDRNKFFELARKTTRSLKAYIDDFAQIFGQTVDLKKDRDEICAGPDSQAQSMILDKNCAAMLYAKQKHIKPLGVLDSNLQHVVYITKYSKLKK
ncbi:MAG: class II aldolase/adducin family protein [Bacillota bacterium]|nr:class II aldolase/adducin family protein [Bacillota bacterium]